ncbi:hypothetical protein FACS1894166_07370 [Bacilli bacterium]|nr:hypothetical protein FACS1894166_07370 [Bacilli bacterium]
MSESTLAKNRKKQTPTKPKSKVGFLSAILLVVGSSIGAGIFLKNGEILSNVTGSNPETNHILSIVLCMICWIIAIAGILAMGLTLTEICSGAGNNNSQGIIGWVKTFNNQFLYQALKNFMAYIYLPTNMVVMGYYATEMILEGLPHDLGYKVP